MNETSPLIDQKLAEWRDIKSHLQEWYAEPDLECLRAALAVYQSHFEKEAPIWMFLLGPPSTGKSEICILPLSHLPQAQTVSTITESSFITSFNEKYGILPNLTGNPKNGVLLFSDFSNFLALKAETRGKLQAQLREIYDGKYQKHSGNRKNSIEWEGKVSILAACTPDLERYWGLENSLGDRFLQIRLNPPDPDSIYPFMEKQMEVGKDKIQAKTKKLITTFLSDISSHPNVAPPDKELTKYIFYLTDICVSLRQAVHRNFKGEVSDIGTKEGTPRFARMAINLARTHAKLFARTNLKPIDNRLMKRVLLDTCPSRRLSIVRMLLGQTETVSMNDIRQFFPGLSYPTTYRAIEDLELLQIIHVEKVYKEKFIRLTDKFREMLVTAHVAPLTSGQ